MSSVGGPGLLNFCLCKMCVCLVLQLTMMDFDFEIACLSEVSTKMIRTMFLTFPSGKTEAVDSYQIKKKILLLLSIERISTGKYKSSVEQFWSSFELKRIKKILISCVLFIDQSRLACFSPKPIRSTDAFVSCFKKMKCSQKNAAIVRNIV